MSISSTLPETGGGYPFVATGARPVDLFDREALVTFTMTLSTDAEAEANGLRVLELAREACVARDLERVAVLHVMFRNLVCRVPEFHALVRSLECDRNALIRLLDLPRRGAGRRPGDKLNFVALIEHVMDAQGFDEATSAIAWLVEHRRDLDLPEGFMPVAKTMQNHHARYGEYFRLWSSSVYVKPELLTLLPPELPGVRYTSEQIEMARFPPKDGRTWPHAVLVEMRPAVSTKKR